MLSDDNLLESDPNLAFPGLWDLILATRANPANLFESWGKEPVFEKNAPAVAAALKLDGKTPPDDKILDLIEGTDILERIPFRTVRAEEPIGIEEYDVIVPAGTINWSIRRVIELKLQMSLGLTVKRIFALASDRICDAQTELNHSYVHKYLLEICKQVDSRTLEPGIFHNLEGLVVTDEPALPTEAQLLAFIIQDITGLKVDNENLIVGKTLDDNIAALATDHLGLWTWNIYSPGNANASVSLQIRRGIKKAFPSFELFEGKFTFSRDGFPLARTPAQAADPEHYQRPFTALSGIVRDLNERHLLTP